MHTIPQSHKVIFLMTLCNTYLQFSADVVACNRNPDTDQVQGLDTYNDPTERANHVDPNQTNIVHFSGNYSNGRIMCRYIDHRLSVTI